MWWKDSSFLTLEQQAGQGATALRTNPPLQSREVPDTYLGHLSGVIPVTGYSIAHGNTAGNRGACHRKFKMRRPAGPAAGCERFSP
jgi:hypothetical protein